MLGIPNVDICETEFHHADVIPISSYRPKVTKYPSTKQLLHTDKMAYLPTYLSRRRKGGFHVFVST